MITPSKAARALGFKGMFFFEHPVVRFETVAAGRLRCATCQSDIAEEALSLHSETHKARHPEWRMRSTFTYALYYWCLFLTGKLTWRADAA